MNELSFNKLRETNVRRCNEAFRPLEDWSPTDWGCAMAGEAGEACNLLKKMLRGEDVPLDHVAAELADVVTYVDLLAARLGIDLGAAVVRKFDICASSTPASLAPPRSTLFCSARNSAICASLAPASRAA